VLPSGKRADVNSITRTPRLRGTAELIVSWLSTVAGVLLLAKASPARRSESAGDGTAPVSVIVATSNTAMTGVGLPSGKVPYAADAAVVVGAAVGVAVGVGAAVGGAVVVGAAVVVGVVVVVRATVVGGTVDVGVAVDAGASVVADVSAVTAVVDAVDALVAGSPTVVAASSDDALGCGESAVARRSGVAVDAVVPASSATVAAAGATWVWSSSEIADRTTMNPRPATATAPSTDAMPMLLP